MESVVIDLRILESWILKVYSLYTCKKAENCGLPLIDYAKKLVPVNVNVAFNCKVGKWHVAFRSSTMLTCFFYRKGVLQMFIKKVFIQKCSLVGKEQEDVCDVPL